MNAPEPGQAEPGTAYHATITDLRRGIAEEACRWELRSWEILSRARGDARSLPPGPAELRAASLMAGNFGYTLAAVLGVAYREFGPEAGGRLASLADNVITNGDDDDLNADVLPGAAEREVPQPAPGAAAIAARHAAEAGLPPGAAAVLAQAVPEVADMVAERDGLRKALRAIMLGIAEPSPKQVAEDALNGRYFDPDTDAGVWNFGTGPKAVPEPHGEG